MILLIRAIKSNSFWILSAEENFVIKEESVFIGFFLKKPTCIFTNGYVFKNEEFENVQQRDPPDIRTLYVTRLYPVKFLMLRARRN